MSDLHNVYCKYFCGRRWKYVTSENFCHQEKCKHALSLKDSCDTHPIKHKKKTAKPLHK